MGATCGCNALVVSLLVADALSGSHSMHGIGLQHKEMDHPAGSRLLVAAHTDETCCQQLVQHLQVEDLLDAVQQLLGNARVIEENLLATHVTHTFQTPELPQKSQFIIVTC